ncbi:MAG: TIGR03089 family protein [Actinoplanes sp.]
MAESELLTWYDGATGERVGLAAADVGEWSAATAAMLVDECGLGPGSTAAVLLPPHWQTATVLLGCWSAGLEVSFRAWSTAGLIPAGEPVDATFVERRRVGNWLDDVPAGRHQFVLDRPGSSPPDGYRDYVTSVQRHLGGGAPAPAVGAHLTASPDGTTFGEYGAIAADLAATQGIRPGDRVLVDADAHEQPLTWLLAPLSAGASVVLCANLDRSRLADLVAAEKVTLTLLG